MQNPFEEDTSYYKKLLDVDSHQDVLQDEGVTTVEAEPVVEEVTPSFIDQHTSSGFNQGIFGEPDAIDRYRRMKQESERKKDEMNKRANEVFLQLFTDLNAKYGLDIKFSVDSFKQSIEYIIEPSNQRAFDLYVSEAYSRVRSTSYMKMLQAVVLLVDQLLDPKYLVSDSMTYEAKFKMLDDLFNMMTKIEVIYDTIKIKDADVKLRQISQGNIGAIPRAANSLESKARLGLIFSELDKRTAKSLPENTETK